MSPSSRRRPAGGFTLIELLIAMIITAIVAAIALSAILSGMNATRVGAERSVALADLQTATERIGRELRAAQPLALDENANYGTQLGAVVYRGGGRTVYYWTVEEDAETGLSNLLQDTVRYGDVTDDTPSQVLSQTFVTRVSNSVDNPLFRYFDSNGDEITCTDATASCRAEHGAASRVQLTLRLELEQHDQPITAQTAVTVRSTQMN